MARSAVSKQLIKITPAHLRALGQRLLDDKVECVGHTFGGEAFPSSTAEIWRRVSPSARLVNEYGPTETVVGSQLPGSVDVPTGRPIANTQIYILDQRRHPVPIGVTGEIYIGGAGVARGYTNRPELTAERFVEIEGLGRVYRSGDLGRWLSDGNIEYLGRNDFQVKIRGFRIELNEIAAILCEYPGVQEAVVTLGKKSSGHQFLVAYVVPRQNSVVREE